MKQVNTWISDGHHILLVKMAASLQLETGKIVTLSKVAANILEQSLNGKPDNNSGDKSDNKPDVPKPAGPIRVSPPTDDTQSETTTDNPFSDLSF